MAPFLTFLRSNAHWLAAGAMLTFLSSFGQTYFIAIFGGVLREEFGLSNGQWGGLYTLATTASAGVMIWAGTLTDRFRVRTLGVAVLVCLALAALAMGAVRSVAMLGVVIFALRLFGQGMSSHIAIVAMARWFVATRGRALAIAGLGIALGEMVLPVGFVALMAAGLPWRVLWVVSAGILVAALPVLLLLLRRERTPQSLAGDNPAPGMGGRHWARGEMLRHGLFWAAVPALLGPPAFSTALFFHQVHLAEAKGWAHLGFVALFPLFTAGTMVGMATSGWAVDRFGTGRVLRVYLLPFAAAFAVMWMAGSLALAGLAMFLVGIGGGANNNAVSAFWAEFYGTRHLGAIKSAAAAVMVFGSAVGPGVTGALIDRGLPFEGQMLPIAGYFVAALGLFAVALARAGRALSPRPAQVDVTRA